MLLHILTILLLVFMLLLLIILLFLSQLNGIFLMSYKLLTQNRFNLFLLFRVQFMFIAKLLSQFPRHIILTQTNSSHLIIFQLNIDIIKWFLALVLFLMRNRIRLLPWQKRRRIRLHILIKLILFTRRNMLHNLFFLLRFHMRNSHSFNRIQKSWNEFLRRLRKLILFLTTTSIITTIITTFTIIRVAVNISLRFKRALRQFLLHFHSFVKCFLLPLFFFRFEFIQSFYNVSFPVIKRFQSNFIDRFIQRYIRLKRMLFMILFLWLHLQILQIFLLFIASFVH